MHPGRTTTIGRLIRAATAAFALALLLGGLAATPAAAQTERQAAGQAQDFIDWCFANGGEPHAYSSTFVQCYIPSGSGGIMFTCDFYPERDCSTVSGPALNPPFVNGTAPPLVRPPAGNGYHGGHGTLQFSGGGTSGTNGTGSGSTTLHTATAGGQGGSASGQTGGNQTGGNQTTQAKAVAGGHGNGRVAHRGGAHRERQVNQAHHGHGSKK